MRALIVLPLLVSTAYAGNNELSIGSSVRALRSSSADALTGDSLVGGTARVARVLDMVPMPADHLAFWVFAGVDWGSATGTMFQTLATEVGGVALTAGAGWRYTPIRHVAASAQLASGAERASVRLEDSAGNSASGHAWNGVFRSSVELDLLAIDTPGFALGMRFELGYHGASHLDIVPQRAHPDDMLQIPMAGAPLGGLSLAGPYFDVGLIAQF